MKAAVLVLRVILGTVFLYAGLVKFSASAQFALALVPFTFVPSEWLGGLALGLTITETLAGVLILLPWTQRLGAMLILLLSLVFIAALGWALANGIIVSCACFGQDETPSAGKMMAAMGRDVAIAGAAAVVLLRRRSSFKV